MGCTTSKQPDFPDQPDYQNKSNLTHDPAEKEKIAKHQRRKLSVAPQHVGDIQGQDRKGSIASGATPAYVQAQQYQQQQQPAPAGSLLDADELQFTGSNLSAIDQAAQQQIHHCIHGTRSRKGVVPYNRNKVNQDRGFIRYALGERKDVAAFGVMDGHGEFGHLVASFVQEHLPAAIDSQPATLLLNDTESAIHTSVQTVVGQLRESQINAAFSGTTCVFGVKVGQELFVANIGDSRCVLARQTAPGMAAEPVPLTEDQKPEVPAEKARILAAGGRVEPLPGPPGEDCGPPRVWLAEVDVPGLAMSRSIGDDVSQTVGVTSTPAITKHTIQSNDIFAVWASDGVWEFLSNEEVIGIIWQHRHNLHQAATALVEESVRQWKSQEEVVDDITCVIVQFNPPQ